MKILLIDIETRPLLAYVWSIWQQDVALNQIHSEWAVISFAAKWLGETEIIYSDLRHQKNTDDDKPLLKKVWNLIDEADILITQNGKRFDAKKLNARFILNGIDPPSPVRHIDTLVIAKKHFAFTSNKLEYLSEKLTPESRKTKSKKFSGFELWSECLKGNQDAWKELELYNRQDIVALEAVYKRLYPWDNSINFQLENTGTCTCGSTRFRKKGFFFSNVGKYQRYKCLHCGAHSRSKLNLLTCTSGLKKTATNKKKAT